MWNATEEETTRGINTNKNSTHGQQTNLDKMIQSLRQVFLCAGSYWHYQSCENCLKQTRGHKCIYNCVDSKNFTNCIRGFEKKNQTLYDKVEDVEISPTEEIYTRNEEIKNYNPSIMQSIITALLLYSKSHPPELKESTPFSTLMFSSTAQGENPYNSRRAVHLDQIQSIITRDLL